MPSKLEFKRYFTTAQTHPYDAVDWVKRDALIIGAGGKEIYRQDGVEFPDFWSQQAINIVASKYFAGAGAQRENSLKQLIDRVIGRTVEWALYSGLFSAGGEVIDYTSSLVFTDELTHILLHQYAAFNSPVWFNLGVNGRRQAVSACYIQSIQDSMGSIRDLYEAENLLFVDGSGSGTNFSSLRASGEPLSGGGTSSGPMAFIQGLDAASGAIKSGGKTRRAAKMVVLNADHPDVFDFVGCKVRAEDMAQALVAAGFSGEFNDPNGVYASLPFQNANNSVRVTDDFMRAVEADGNWQLTGRIGGPVMKTVKARELWQAICQAAWRCGDPGLQFDTTINAWHTSKASGRINASNPCSEYLFLDDSACNLASINLMKCRNVNGGFDYTGFRHIVRVLITAMEAFVGNADYPTDKIRDNSHKFRPLGLGYANLGALIMSEGYAYDSKDGRELAADITDTMTCEAYRQSAVIASVVGPFPGYAENKASMLEVLNKHFEASFDDEGWHETIALAETFGVRNAQVTVLAPTGTIGFMMDCDTTGIEPCLALTSYKKLVGGGTMVIVNETARTAAKRLGFVEIEHLMPEGFAEWLATLPEAYRAIFDCSLPDASGRSIDPLGHVRMMAAVQPFLSGAISKTVNMPANSTVEDVANVYMESWKAGLKAVAIYRDGCKGSQPVSSTDKKVADRVETVADSLADKPRKLPKTRQSLTHKFRLGEHTGYLTVGLYEDGTPGELFVRMSKEGSTISGLLDSWAITVSIALQGGIPLTRIADKLAYTRFEPSGWTGDAEIGQASSVTDYIMRWLANRFAGATAAVAASPMPALVSARAATAKRSGGAPPCATCGTITERSGSCYRCPGCGNTTGCS